LTISIVKGIDCVAIITDHTVYGQEMIVKNSSSIVDTRNATASVGGKNEKVIKLQNVIKL